MDHHCRRGRRGRCHSHTTVRHSFSPPCDQKPWSFLSAVYSFTIMSCLIALIYLMLDYHCTICQTKCNLGDLTRSIDDIAKNLTVINNNYQQLEAKIFTITRELPKLEGQIEILEALANTLECEPFGCNPQTYLGLPNVDVFLNKGAGDKTIRNYNRDVNCSSKCIKMEQAF